MDWDHIIHKYINHRLTNEEQSLFDRLYKDDAEFKSEVEMITDLQRIVESNDQDKLKMIMNEAEAEFSTSNKKNSTPFIKNWWIIIAIMLLSSLLGYYLLNSKPSSSQLFASYYKTPPNSYYPVTRGEPNTSDTRRAFLAYEQKDFIKAEELLSDLSPNDEINFYRAISLGELKEFKNAIELLNTINTKDPILREDIWWYKGLYQLAQSDKVSAMTSFQKIASTNNPSRKKLLNELME